LILGALAASSSLFTVATASPAFKRHASQSVQDKVVQHLQDSNVVTWKPAGNGHYVDIHVDSLNKAMAATGVSNFNKTKRDTPNDGSVSGYTVTQAVCYNGGALATDNDITQFAVSACDALVGNLLPPLAQNTLRIWQSAQQADVNGLASYIRFGVRFLNPTTIADTSLCQAAIDAFNSYCQNGPSESQGGELDVGGVVRFSADPTDLSNNQ